MLRVGLIQALAVFMQLDRNLDVLIPHRLRAARALNLAARYLMRWDAPVPMEIFFNKKLCIEGTSSAITNPMIEAGLIHCRALLEFLGLSVKNGSLANVTLPRRKDDIGIEHFSNSAGPLPLVSPEDAVAPYSGDRATAEAALIMVLHVSNKGLAHFTSDLERSVADVQMLEIASRGIEVLVHNKLYTPLGRAFPDVEIPSRPRPDC